MLDTDATHKEVLIVIRALEALGMQEALLGCETAEDVKVISAYYMIRTERAHRKAENCVVTRLLVRNLLTNFQRITKT